jgi:hypothetical protein
MGKSYRDTRGKFVDYRKPKRLKRKLKKKATKFKEKHEDSMTEY